MAIRPSDLHAQATDVDAPPRHVEVRFVSTSDDAGLEAPLSDLLGRLQVSVHFARISTVDTRQIMTDREVDPPAVARIWIDLRDSSRVTLYLSGSRVDRLLVRHVPVVDRIDEVAREEVAQIVQATVDALLVGGRLGVVTDETPTKTIKPEPERPPHAIALGMGLGYTAQAWSTSGNAVVHGPSVFIGLFSLSGSVRPGLLFSGELRFPTTIDGDPISTRLDQGALRALAIADVPLSRRLAVRLGLGGGVDLIHIAPEHGEGPNVELSPARLSTVPMLRLLASLRFSFSSRSDAFAGVAADYDCFDTRYSVERDATREVVFHPWRLRPMALVGVSSDVLGH